MEKGVSRIVIEVYPRGQPTCVMSYDDSGLHVWKEIWTRLGTSGRLPIMEEKSRREKR